MRTRSPLLLLLWLCACGAQPLDDAAGVVRLDRAELLLDAGPDPPAATGAWVAGLAARSLARATAGGPAWYRFEVPGPAAPGETWAVYLPHVNMNAAGWVNGAAVGSGGSFSEPVANNFNRPLLFAFPSELLARPRNDVHVRFFAYAHGHGELGTAWIGPDAALRPRYEASLFQRTALSQVATALCVVVALFAGGLWLGSRRDPVYGWLAVVTTLWGIASFNYWLRDLPVSHWAWERTIHPAIDGFMLALAVWAHRYVGVRRPRLERLLAVAAGLSVLLAWQLPREHFNSTVNIVHGVVFPAAAYGTGLILLRERRSHPARPRSTSPRDRPRSPSQSTIC